MSRIPKYTSVEVDTAAVRALREEQRRRRLAADALEVTGACDALIHEVKQAGFERHARYLDRDAMDGVRQDIERVMRSLVTPTPELLDAARGQLRTLRQKWDTLDAAARETSGAFALEDVRNQKEGSYYSRREAIRRLRDNVPDVVRRSLGAASDAQVFQAVDAADAMLLQGDVPSAMEKLD